MKRVALFQAIVRPARRWAAVFALATAAIGGTAAGHHPDTRNLPIRQPIDLIGPVGNRLPPGHRRVYNRPSYVGGKLAYWIAPSSQEAMAWHRAVHAGAYRKPKKHLRLEQHFFYAKPWEVLQVGPRRSVLEPPAEEGFDPEQLSEETSLRSRPLVERAEEPEFSDELMDEPGDAKLPPLSPPGVESPSDLPQTPQSPERSASPQAGDPPAEGSDSAAEKPETPATAAVEEAGSQSEAPAPSTLYQPVLEPPLKDGGVKVDPNAGAFLFHRGGVTRAMGLEMPSPRQASAVSRASVSRQQAELENAEKPVFLRRWWSR